MNLARCPVFVVCIAITAILHAGCASGRAYHRGRQAEKNGEAWRAYDHYCKAAGINPGNGARAAAIRRVRPQAAAHWESEARAAADEGRWADAWRLWMRTLTIRPDHPDAPRAIRELEQQHAEPVAAARRDWLRLGSPALALSAPAGEAGPGRSEATPQVVASAGLETPAADTPEAVQASPAPPEDKPLVMAAAPAQRQAESFDHAETSDQVAVVEPNPNQKPLDTRRKTLVAPPSRRWGNTGETPVPQDTDGVEADARSSEAPREASASHPGRRRWHALTRKRADPSTRSPRPIIRAKPFKTLTTVRSGPAAGSIGAAGKSEFLRVHTLSKKDRRYPKELVSVDGVVIKLRDTDDDLDADFNLYAGDRRIKKIRELAIGRSQTFRGPSGKRFRLIVLSVHHRTHTVRIGISPA